jgi:hypothetical protein
MYGCTSIIDHSMIFISRYHCFRLDLLTTAYSNYITNTVEENNLFYESTCSINEYM